jgi:hypothetical protein
MKKGTGVLLVSVVCAFVWSLAVGATGGEVILIPHLDDGAAAAALGASNSLVWDREAGIALAELPEGREVPEAIRSLAPISIRELGGADTFEEALACYMPDYDPAISNPRFAAMVPMTLTRPLGAPARSASMVAAAPEAVCLTEGFESTSTWSEYGGNWLHYEGGHSNGYGSYFWTDTSCDAIMGSRAADAVRGGSLGSGLSCTAYYATNTESWMEYDPLITCAHSATYARLSFLMKAACETNYDFLFCGISTDGYQYSGYAYTGYFTSSWYWIVKDMRAWYSLGDLTNYSGLTLAFVFLSDYIVNTGFGARIDNVVVSTEPLPHLSSVAKKGAPFRFIALGSGFQQGVRVFINGNEWTNVTWKNSTKVKIGGGKSLKVAVPRGVSTPFVFLNPDGGYVTTNVIW